MKRTEPKAFQSPGPATFDVAGQQSQIFLLAVEHIAESVVITDREGIIIYVNGGFERLSGYDRTELIGQHPSIFRSGHHSPSFFSRMNRVLYAGRVFHGVVTSRAKNGDLFWEDKTITPITNTDGEITHFISTSRDISEVRRSRELELRLSAAEEAEQLKTDLLSTVSHELRTPLAAIMGYATAILDYGEGLGPAKITEYLRNLETRGKQLQRLIDDLLTMSRLESGNLPHVFEQVCLQDLIGEVMNDSRLGDGFAVPGELPKRPLYASIDASRIRTVLQNLVENAEKHSGPAENVTISASPLSQGWIEITVRDQGRGVEPSELEAIFQRFYRTKAENATNLAGAGLGLSICKGIIEAHGGTIRAHLPTGGGLAISFTVPRSARRRPSSVNQNNGQAEGR
jgi:PAS domain S-box-containing protein